jgi:hypothetical protein
MQPRGHNETTALGDLASILWRLRELLNHLLFKIVVQRLILESGQTGWLANATRELDAALHEVRTAEVLRAARVDGLARRLGLAAGSTLAEMADAAPEPWRTVLHEHREALNDLVADVDAVADDGPVPAARTGVDHADDLLFEEVVRPVALQTLARARQSSLVDFLK